MNKEELKKILELHKKWVQGKKDGKQADLRGAQLQGADLRGAQLQYAQLQFSDLQNAQLQFSDLRNAQLRGADLRGAQLQYAQLQGADLRNVQIRKTKIDETVMKKFFPLACPEFGSFIGFKKAGNYIIRLEILENAKRSSAFGRKCRCEAARCIAIENLYGTDSELTEIASDRDADFIYKIGEVAKVDNFDEDRKNECSTGIHFFITRQEAVDYTG